MRVAYLGRKSELALALREVRDRETGMLLNGIRGGSRRRSTSASARSPTRSSTGASARR